MVSIYKKNDIRGIYPTELNEELATKIGFLIGKKLNQGNNVAIAGDCRLSTPQIKMAVISGLNMAGITTYDLGMGPTPLVYYVSKTEKIINAGIVITASHNPKEYTGIKVCDQEGVSFSDITLFNDIRNEIDYVNLPTNYDLNLAKNGSQLAEKYYQYLRSNFKFTNNLRIAVDYGNGAVGSFSKILKDLGCQVNSIRDEADGTFPTIIPDPTKSKTFDEIRSVIDSENYDIGITFDTDGDRVGFITPNKQILSPDIVVMLFGEEIQQRKDTTILLDLKISKASADFLESLGSKIEYSQTGHSWVHKKLIDTHADLAAELSSHYYFEDRYYGFDDGLYSALRFLEILDTIISNNLTIDEKISSLPSYYSTPEYRTKMPNTKQDIVLSKLTQFTQEKGGKSITIDGIRGEFDDGWFIARKSGTEEALSYRIESKTSEMFEKLKHDVLEIINNV